MKFSDIKEILNGSPHEFAESMLISKIKEVDAEINKLEKFVMDTFKESGHSRNVVIAMEVFIKPRLQRLERHRRLLGRLAFRPDAAFDLDVEAARRRDIVDVAMGLGLEPRRRGSLWVARCPFHHERTPSFTLYPESNDYYCFGCGAYGDVIDLYMKLAKVGFKRAVRELQ